MQNCVHYVVYYFVLKLAIVLSVGADSGEYEFVVRKIVIFKRVARSPNRVWHGLYIRNASEPLFPRLVRSSVVGRSFLHFPVASSSDENLVVLHIRVINRC